MLQLEGADSFPSLNVMSADSGSIVYPPGSTHGPRLQRFYQLVLLDTGSAEVDIDGVSHRLEPGEVAFLRPGHHEFFRFSKQKETRHRWIHIRCAPPSPEDAAMMEGLPFVLPLREPIGRLTDLMHAVELTIGKQAGSALLCSLGLSALLHYIAESRNQEAQHSQHPSVRTAQHTVRSRLHEPLTLEVLAQAAHVTPEHLIRLFRRDLNTTPMRYLWHIRAERAVWLLRSTGLSVGEISRLTGFQTSYHFARLIKKETGMTPTEIRRRSWRTGL